MKYALVALGSMLCLAGCYPALRTVQPKVELVVSDPKGRPVEGATFTLATYRYPFPMQTSTKYAQYQSNAAGVVSISRRATLQMEILLPDGSSWYVWGYCIEKPGYRAIAVAESRFKGRQSIVLEPYQGSSRCRTPAVGEDYVIQVVEQDG